MANSDATRRDRLKVTFDHAADTYHQARPDYPAELYDELIAAAGLRPGARLLEVGCGTGKATLPLAQRGFAITALELGPRLAVSAADRLAAYERVHVVQHDFETWQPSDGLSPDGEGYDLVYAATAWHWIDPAVGYGKAWRLLRPGGHLATWAAWHAFPPDADPFFRQIQEVYDEIGEALPPGARWPGPGELPSDRAAVDDTGLFAVTCEREFIWALDYTASEYLALLDTFSGHIAMAQWQRDRLYGEIRRRLAQRPDGLLRRHWGAVLLVARRRDEADVS